MPTFSWRRWLNELRGLRRRPIGPVSFPDFKPAVEPLECRQVPTVYLVNTTIDNVNDTTSTLYTGALQFWLTPIVWLKGGLGLGNTTFGNNIDGFTGATAFAIMGGAGVELVQRGPFALDLQGRVGHTFFSNADGGPITQYAFMIGFNWY